MSPNSDPAGPRTFLFLTQVYVPDPASVGQHMADAAAELARRGHRVYVITSRRGYDDPRAAYPARERIDGVEVVRVPFASFGKRTVWHRLAGAASFVVQAALRGLWLRRPDAIVVSTSPPLAPAAALFLSVVRRAPIRFWVMDLSPDQLIELGILKEGSVPVHIFEWLNRRIFRRASDMVVLDRFMEHRVADKYPAARDKMTVIPPWPHEDHLVSRSSNGTNPFRERHGLTDKFVVMYSGNHTPSNPITTILDAAERLRDVSELAFVFVGGGVAKQEVEERDSPNIYSLPYQPLEQLGTSLSAADVHVVSVGDRMVGMIHPCKVYGAMAVGRPVLLLGPEKCHVADIIEEHGIGWHVRHGDVEGATRLLKKLVDGRPSELRSKAVRSRTIARERFSKPELCGRLCSIVERARSKGMADLIPERDAGVACQPNEPADSL